MLFRSGKNWIFDLFLRRGWLVKRRRFRRRQETGSRPSIVAAECQCLENRTLLSTITVTSLADTLNAGAANGVTLRDAIQAANTDSSVDGSVAGQAGVQNVIDFQAGLNGTILLDTGLGPMSISSSMKIEGLGAANTTIDAQHNLRIFNITATAGDVTLDSLTIENGKTTDNGSRDLGSPGTPQREFLPAAERSIPVAR
jgi:CSLREA domain-containing protein